MRNMKIRRWPSAMEEPSVLLLLFMWTIWIPVCWQPVQTFLFLAHSVHWPNQRKICSRYATQSQSHSYAHKSARQSELSWELAPAKVCALPVTLIIPSMLCDIHTQARSPPKRKHSYEMEIWKPPRSQWRVSPLIYHSFSLLISFFLFVYVSAWRPTPANVCPPPITVFLFPF